MDWRSAATFTDFTMQYKDLRDFIGQLEQLGELKRIATPVSPNLEMTEICDRLLRAEGPAVLFEKPSVQSRNDAGAGHDAIYKVPVLANLFGTTRRVAMGMGAELARGPARHRPGALARSRNPSRRAACVRPASCSRWPSPCGTWRPSA